jgi:excisionase family DNA binding protein
MFESYDDILTIEELAEALKIGTSHAYKLVHLGKIKAFKEGKDWKIAKQALIRYVAEQSYF